MYSFSIYIVLPFDLNKNNYKISNPLKYFILTEQMYIGLDIACDSRLCILCYCAIIPDIILLVHVMLPSQDTKRLF